MLLRKSASLESTIRSSEITPQQSSTTPARPPPLPHRSRRPRRRRHRRRIHPRSILDPATTVHAADTAPDRPQQIHPPTHQTPFGKATTYNNFYEFGTDKSDPANNAHTLQTRPWTVQVTGMVKKPQTINIDDLINYRPIESRVYRHRCVEAWSMVIPWDGYSLSEFINFCEPLPSAKYVQFISARRPQADARSPRRLRLALQRRPAHGRGHEPLALLTFGCYGQTLPNQNGAPIRVVVPWKYGFKNGKSIVRFHFTDKQPHTTWNQTDAQRIRLLLQRQPQRTTIPAGPRPTSAASTPASSPAPSPP